MRLIDADALIDDVMERYCKECNKRKGIKNGKYRIIYEIGEVPCRACEVDDIEEELENIPTSDAVEVVRCKDCRKKPRIAWVGCPMAGKSLVFDEGYCHVGERREERRRG